MLLMLLFHICSEKDPIKCAKEKNVDVTNKKLNGNDTSQAAKTASAKNRPYVVSLYVSYRQQNVQPRRRTGSVQDIRKISYNGH